MAKKGKFKREIETLLIADENNAIRNNYVKVKKIDNRQPNTKVMVNEERRDETIDHTRSECIKLAQKGY